eukprot:TRINITY_DN33820_c0_g1_i2.p7 TRINITY_DN33820_c0_g1~~TRINITY_DN33820_c0_g1_i2.p7  ORF type:complete len:111 (+),score=1.84 TRINITY_DN33820_c0_g1_i2:472-804(+)
MYNLNTKIQNYENRKNTKLNETIKIKEIKTGKSYLNQKNAIEKTTTCNDNVKITNQSYYQPVHYTFKSALGNFYTKNADHHIRPDFINSWNKFIFNFVQTSPKTSIYRRT